MCADGVYCIQSWIDGTEAESWIPALPGEKQYAYGVEAERFAAGMVDGYFDEMVPMDFWRLLALYISSIR